MSEVAAVERKKPLSAPADDLLLFGSHPYLDRLPLARRLRALAAPLAIAQWINCFAPYLKAKQELDLIVVSSAENLEFEDAGVWYQLLPDLLDCNATIDVTVLPALESLGWMKLGRKTRFSRSRPPREDFLFPGLRPAKFVQTTLHELLAREPHRAVDLVVLLDADLADTNRRLLSTGGIEASLARGAVVAVSSNELHSFEKQQWLLTQYGFGVTDAVDQAGFVELGIAEDDDIEIPRWSDVLWQIYEAPATAPRPGDPEAMKRLDNFELYQLAIEKSTAERSPRAHLGQVGYQIKVDEEIRDVVGLPSGLFVDMTSGALMYADPEDPDFLDVYKNAGGFVVPRNVLARYPDSESLQFERALWATETAQLIENTLSPRTPAVVLDSYEEDGDEEVVDVLRAIRNGLKTEASDSVAIRRPTPGAEALFRTLAKGQWGAAINMLLENSSLVNAVNEHGETPAFFFLHKDRTDFQKLRRLGANISHKNNLGYSLIHRIAQAGSASAARFCLMSGVDVDLTCPNGLTPAILAAINENFPVLETLLLHGASLKKKTELGFSLFDIAGALKMPESLAHLFQHRLNPN
ncbi:ankyrin repeat domain-containing protein [Paraburkholderia sp. SIMBA_054]|uniref:ankyrin repeat domain-containing protein n=1 Tax=Paraburkholderia sp. SIMBA_054 TaxID=3085795 RepID=UPI00397C7862